MRKIDLITGFLGSGKTTFLLKYARYLMDKGLRIGILEYDYGAVNIDMVLLSELRGPQCEIEMVAAACDADCLRRRFRTKLISMAMSGYDRVIVEPSGIFDMDMFFDELREEPLERWYEIGSVITVVNAKLQDSMTAEEDFILASEAVDAGCILLSRVQLASEEEIERTKEHLDRAQHGISCNGYRPNFLIKDWEMLTDEDFEMLMNCGYKVCSYVKVTGGLDSEYSSVCFLNEEMTAAELREKIRKLFASDEYGNVSRVKGFTVENGKGFEVNATKYEMLENEMPYLQNALIVIGTGLAENRIRELIQSRD